MSTKAFIFDLNGTMVDDMAYHEEAWEFLLNNELNANMTQEEVKSHMYGKNTELLVRVFGEGHFTEEEMNELSIRKEKIYQKAFLPKLKLIDGLDKILKDAYDKGIKLAIGSAAIPFNVDFVLYNLNIRHYFSVIVCADDVKESKPHPETYLKCAERLQLKPEECIVFEDAPKGVEAAENAGMKAVAITTYHDKVDFAQYKNVVKYLANYEGVGVEDFL